MTTQTAPERALPAPRACFACGHLHDPASAGRCWEAACHPACRETPSCPLPYTPDEARP